MKQAMIHSLGAAPIIEALAGDLRRGLTTAPVCPGWRGPVARFTVWSCGVSEAVLKTPMIPVPGHFGGRRQLPQAIIRAPAPHSWNSSGYSINYPCHQSPADDLDSKGFRPSKLCPVISRVDLRISSPSLSIRGGLWGANHSGSDNFDAPTCIQL